MAKVRKVEGNAKEKSEIFSFHCRDGVTSTKSKVRKVEGHELMSSANNAKEKGEIFSFHCRDGVTLASPKSLKAVCITKKTHFYFVLRLTCTNFANEIANKINL